MPGCCCVPGCSNHEGGFTFPQGDGKKDCETVRDKWIQAIKRVDDNKKDRKWLPTKHAVVCASHFKESDFQPVKQYAKLVHRTPCCLQHFITLSLFIMRCLKWHLLNFLLSVKASYQKLHCKQTVSEAPYWNFYEWIHSWKKITFTILVKYLFTKQMNQVKS